MANAIPAAGMPAATTYPRWRATGGGGWADAPDGRTLKRERLETRARTTDATGQLLRCFPRWSRALEQLTSQALGRLAGNEPVDPNDPDVWRSRDAHARAVLHRHGHGKVSADPTHVRRARCADRRAGPRRPQRRVGLEHGHRSGVHPRRGVAPVAREPADRPRGSVGFGRIRSTSGVRSRARSGSRTVERTICRGGCWLTPTSSTPRTCAVGGSARTPGSRSPVSSSAAWARWSGRSACSSCGARVE
jgi:hypothetical protein